LPTPIKPTLNLSDGAGAAAFFLCCCEGSALIPDVTAAVPIPARAAFLTKFLRLIFIKDFYKFFVLYFSCLFIIVPLNRMIHGFISGAA
jgi:hypothetical protein